MPFQQVMHHQTSCTGMLAWKLPICICIKFSASFKPCVGGGRTGRVMEAGLFTCHITLIWKFQCPLNFLHFSSPTMQGALLAKSFAVKSLYSLSNTTFNTQEEISFRTANCILFLTFNGLLLAFVVWLQHFPLANTLFIGDMCVF